MPKKHDLQCEKKSKIKNKTIIKKKLFIEALKKTLGVVTHASNLLEKEGKYISRQTHYNWLYEDEEYEKKVNEINEMSIDLAESKLMELIKGVEREFITKNGTVKKIKEPPNVAAVIFFLKTRGKNRGYTTSINIGGQHGENPLHHEMNITGVNIVDYSDEVEQ